MFKSHIWLLLVNTHVDVFVNNKKCIHKSIEVYIYLKVNNWMLLTLLAEMLHSWTWKNTIIILLNYTQSLDTVLWLSKQLWPVELSNGKFILFHFLWVFKLEKQVTSWELSQDLPHSKTYNLKKNTSWDLFSMPFQVDFGTSLSLYLGTFLSVFIHWSSA